MSIVKTCYDKLLPREVNRPQRMMSFGNRQRAVFVFRKMWITGSTLQVRFLEGSASQKALVKEQALREKEEERDRANALEEEKQKLKEKLKHAGIE